MPVAIPQTHSTFHPHQRQSSPIPFSFLHNIFWRFFFFRVSSTLLLRSLKRVLSPFVLTVSHIVHERIEYIVQTGVCSFPLVTNVPFYHSRAIRGELMDCSNVSWFSGILLTLYRRLFKLRHDIIHCNLTTRKKTMASSSPTAHEE